MNPLTFGRCIRCGRRRPIDEMIADHVVSGPFGTASLYRCVDTDDCDATYARNEESKDVHSRRLDHRR